MSYANTKHSQIRMQQRGITKADLDFAITYGQVVHLHGTKFFFLGRRDIPSKYLRTHAHLEGLTVVVNGESGVILTCYRNKSAIRALKQERESGAKRYGRVA